jgi:hypothetical protein
MYKILPYTYEQAKWIGVKVKPSTRKNKKIDVYDSYDNYIVSIGDIRYLDYPTYKKMYGKKYADERRRLYHIRHSKDSNKAGFFAKRLLW